MAEKFSTVDDKLEAGVRVETALDAPVRCWTLAGWRQMEGVVGVKPDSFTGFTDGSAYEIHLHPYTCEWLHALMDGRRFEGEDELQAAGALESLAHEGMHLTSAGSNEALAECRAMQNMESVGAALGVGQAYAQRLGRIYWDEAYPHGDPVYGSPECHQGGTMDLNPNSTVWP